MGLIKEIDYGTPIRLSEKEVTLKIDGQDVTVPHGTSVMAAAMALGTTPRTSGGRSCARA